MPENLEKTLESAAGYVTGTPYVLKAVLPGSNNFIKSFHNADLRLLNPYSQGRDGVSRCVRRNCDHAQGALSSSIWDSAGLANVSFYYE